jgi:hypothetical protein
MEWACSESEEGKALEWLFGVLKKTRSATIDKFFNNHSECKEK